jgi:hypothetical protein
VYLLTAQTASRRSTRSAASGYAVFLDSGNIVYSRHVEIDERPLLQGGLATRWPPEPLLPADTDCQDGQSDAAEYDELADAERSPSAEPPRSPAPAAARAPAAAATHAHNTSRLPFSMAAPPILSDTDNAHTHSPAHTHTKQPTSSSTHTIRCAATARRAAAHVPLPTRTRHGRSHLTLLTQLHTTWLL